MRVKFKFKFVLTTVNYCAFCLFRYCKMTFNFKFKLILRKKKIYVNSFFLNFRGPRFKGVRSQNSGGKNIKTLVPFWLLASRVGPVTVPANNCPVTISATTQSSYRTSLPTADEIRYPVDYRFFPGFRTSTFG